MNSNKKQRLELTWMGKDEELKLEPRILIEDPSKSYGDPKSENMLIHGDNLLALKALEQDFAGKIKCVYIDPPFNTGSAFEHYDDSLEHSTWLTLLKSRIKCLNGLLSNSGFFALHLDDEELAYAKVICDEIFGRSNHLNTITMTTNDPSGFKATASTIFSTANYLLLYAKNKVYSNLKKIYVEKEYDAGYSKVLVNRTAPLNEWTWEDIDLIVAKSLNYDSAREAREKLARGFDDKVAYYALKNSEKVFQLVAIGGGAKLKRQKTIEKSKLNRDKVFVHPGEDIKDFFILNGRQMVFYSNRLKELNGNLVPAQLITDVWTDISWNGIASEGDVEFKNGKKPEKLIQRCLELTTEPGDYVLDSFLGSGTTAAVAHKMGRRWIGVELGDHCHTHCLPRLKKVCDGSDQSGISRVISWKGGGGFKFYELAPSLLRKDKYGNWVIDEQYNANMLAAAICKHEGFKFFPDAQVYWKQGKSNETDYIFVTTSFVTVEQLDKIHEEMKPDESLLICAKSFAPTCKERHNNITIKKIPQMVLGKCEFGKDNYDLNIINAPRDDDEDSE